VGHRIQGDRSQQQRGDGYVHVVIDNPSAGPASLSYSVLVLYLRHDESTPVGRLRRSLFSSSLRNGCAISR
jgi:hypothetical protein